MIAKRIDFVDKLTDQYVSVYVESARVTDSDEADLSQCVFLSLESFSGAVGSSAYIPRKQAKQIIKAIKSVLDATS